MLFFIRLTKDYIERVILKLMIKFFVMIILTLLISGCPAVIEIPWTHRADQKPIYVMKYYTVKPPPGVGWSVKEFEDRDKICFIKYTANSLWPHSPALGCTIIFFTRPVFPEKYNYDINKIWDDRTQYPFLTSNLLGEITINNRMFFEFSRVTGSDAWGTRETTLWYVHLSKDLKIMYVVEIRYRPYGTTWKNLPQDFKTIIESFEPIEGDNK
jgi:hypothetical protein